MPTDKITTAGAIFIKNMLPNDATKAKFDVHRVLDKGGVSDLISNIISNGGDHSHDTINALGHLFFNKATDIGSSTPLSDYINDSEERHALIHEFEIKVREILSSKMSEKDKKDKLSELSGNMTSKLQKQNVAYLVGRGSTAAKMALTGARGNPMQLAQGTASPLMAADVAGNPIPVVITRSFAEGLRPAEHLAMSYGGRASTVLAQASTALPGALFKKLTPNLYHEVVTIQDCGTTNGIIVPIEDKKRCMFHYQAGTNKLIDEAYYKDLLNANKPIKIRSTLTCEAKDGICQKCYGLAANGKLPEIGFNAGVIAAQSASEVLTQAMLSTKHRGGQAGKNRNAYEEANNLLSNPKTNFLDEATLSELDGTVTNIKLTTLEDHLVYVNNVEHFVPRIQDVTVKIGDKVRKGSALSTGTQNPRRLAELQGQGEARIYMADKLRDIYGAGLDPRHFDLIARNMIKHVQVINPGDTHLMPGEKTEINKILPHLRESEAHVNLSEALGKPLSRSILHYTPGTVLTQTHIDDLAKAGVDKVHVSNTGLVVTPIVPGLQTGKLLDSNWISKMSFNKLRDVIRDAGATGAESEIHSTDPITGYVMGSEFGLGRDGKY